MTAAAVLCVSVLLEAFFQLMSDRLQSGAGYMMFAEQRMALGAHLRKLPMGYFTAGNIGKIDPVHEYGGKLSMQLYQDIPRIYTALADCMRWRRASGGR